MDNLRLTDCEFTLSNENSVGMKIGDGSNISVYNTTSDGGKGFAEFDAIDRITLENLTIDSANGVSLGTSTAVKVTDTAITAENYGILGSFANDDNQNVDITGCDIVAAQPVVITKVADDSSSTYDLNVTGCNLVPTSEYDAITTTTGEAMTEVTDPSHTNVTVTETNVKKDADITEGGMSVSIPEGETHITSDGNYENVTINASNSLTNTNVSVIGDVTKGVVQVKITKVVYPQQTGEGVVGIHLEHNMNSPTATVSMTFSPDDGLVLASCSVHYYTDDGANGQIEDVSINGNTVTFTTNHCTEYDFVPTYKAGSDPEPDPEPTPEPEPDPEPTPGDDDEPVSPPSGGDDEDLPPVIRPGTSSSSGDDDTVTIVACAAAAAVAAILAVFLIMAYRKD